jgi:Xaa-Pro aminopeptidase
MLSDKKEGTGTNRSRTPNRKEFLDYISSGWQESPQKSVSPSPAADFAKSRRDLVAAEFPNQLILIEAGAPKTRSNDTEYRYRPHAAFAHLTGWGSQTVPDSVLVLDTEHSNQILFLRPTAGKDSDEFFANPAIGEFWVGARPTLEDVSALLKIDTRDLSELSAYLDNKKTINLDDSELAQFVSELRLVKDSYEIDQMRQAVASSIRGFEDIVKVLPKAAMTPRGERVIETAFFARARLEGNDLGYETIAAAGKNACILHWITNHGPVNSGELVLVDAGVEMDSFYTADITRTLPINGKYSEAQLELYQAVLEAADAAFAVAKPGIKFREIHEAAMKVIASKVAGWGILPVSAETSLESDKQFHRRWMVHGTSHHLGLDVHDPSDCAE